MGWTTETKEKKFLRVEGEDGSSNLFNLEKISRIELNPQVVNVWWDTDITISRVKITSDEYAKLYLGL